MQLSTALNSEQNNPMTSLKNTLPVVSFDTSDPDFVQNPYAAYGDMRAAGDVVFWEDYDMPAAVTVRAVAEIMRHPKMGRSVPGQEADANPALQPFLDLEQHSLLEIEPPDHSRIRRVVAKAFALERMVPLGPRISQIADALIDAFPQGESFDVLEAFAQKLTAQTITTFLGLEDGHASQLRAWSTAMVAMYQKRRDSTIEANAAKAAKDFAAFLNAELDHRKRMPRADFLSELVSAESTGLISRAEAVSTAVLLLNAGQEATAHSIGNALRSLMEYSERALALHPDQIAGTVEECLRFTPPLHVFTRHVYQTATVLDTTFPAGTEIACVLGSACRDDAVWPDGDKFDPFRLRRPHQAFGVGIHACTGTALARLELQLALPILFSRCPNLCIAEPPRVADTYHFHGLDKLYVKWEAPGST